MAKKVTGQIKLQIPAGAANPAPPVGPALGQRGVNIMEFCNSFNAPHRTKAGFPLADFATVNIMEFCKSFNAQTQSMAGFTVPVIVTVFSDRSFTFVTKSPPASNLLLKA